MPFCTRCGKKNHDEAIYCSNCGAKISFQENNDNINEDSTGMDHRIENEPISMHDASKKQAQQQEPLQRCVWYKKYLTPIIVVVAIMFTGLFYLNGSSVNPFASKVTSPASGMPSKNNNNANRVPIDFNAWLPFDYGVENGDSLYIFVKNLNDFDWSDAKIYIGRSRNELYMRDSGIIKSGSTVKIPVDKFLLNGEKYIGCWWNARTVSLVIWAPEYIRIETNEGNTGIVRL